MMLHLEANDITVLRAHHMVLRRISLSLAKGEIIYLRGDNGSGKTTLLQTLAGLITPQAGKVIRHQSLMYLGHRAGVKPLLTVRENLILCAKLYHGLVQEPLAPVIDNALEKVGLISYANRQTRYLSAGQQRRCQLARLWLPSATVWLLDEPLTALDVHVSARLTTQCQHHLQQGGSIIVTSHQPFVLGDYPMSHIELTRHG